MPEAGLRRRRADCDGGDDGEEPCASREGATGFLAENDVNEDGLAGGGTTGVGGVTNVDGVPVAGGVVTIGSGLPFGDVVSARACSWVDVLWDDDGPGGGSVVGDMEASATREGGSDVLRAREGCETGDVCLSSELSTVSAAINGDERVR